MPGKGEAWLTLDIRAKHMREILKILPNIGMIRLFDLTTRHVSEVDTENTDYLINQTESLCNKRIAC